jgi:hypothetical protein
MRHTKRRHTHETEVKIKKVNPVIRALRRGGIEIAPVHNHMLNEEPRIFFLHYWGTGSAERLAETIREAFDQARGQVERK